MRGGSSDPGAPPSTRVAWRSGRVWVCGRPRRPAVTLWWQGWGLRGPSGLSECDRQLPHPSAVVTAAPAVVAVGCGRHRAAELALRVQRLARPPLMAPVLRRASCTSSWAGASRCCTPACAPTAGSSWRRSPGSTSCTSSPSAAGCTRTRSQVSGAGARAHSRCCTRSASPEAGAPSGLAGSQRAGQPGGGTALQLQPPASRSAPPALLGPSGQPRGAGCCPWRRVQPRASLGVGRHCWAGTGTFPVND